MSTGMIFERLIEEVFENQYNYHTDNVRTYTSSHEESAPNHTALACEQFLNNKYHRDKAVLNEMKPYFKGISFLFDLLEDEESKRTLTKVIAFRLLGHQRCKLPLNNELYWDLFRRIENMGDAHDVLEIDFLVPLIRYNLNLVGYPIDVYLPPGGVLIIFGLKQYQYTHNVNVKASSGDYVIDGGACWGDTSLYFAHEVGELGKVYSIEFIPENLRVLRENLCLNPELSDRVEIVERPLWSHSDETLNFRIKGPASNISKNPMDGSGCGFQTIAIDDMVAHNNIKKVDFIKMDIENSELPALKGAVETIKKFRPKLAISVYHSMDELVNIPRFLSELNVGYKFYLAHFTTLKQETVLFASVE